VLGFKELGFQVYFIEQISREKCVDAAGEVAQFEDCINRAYFQQVIEQFDLSNSSALIYENGEQTYGLSYADLLDVAKNADLLVNISGHLKLEDLKRRFHRRVYIDLDPGFTQFWYAGGYNGFSLDDHDFYYTIGENIGTSYCSIPVGGIRWRQIRQPVVLKYWPMTENTLFDRFTTIASWRGPYGPVQFGGTTFGLKVHEFRKFVELTSLVQQPFEIALDINPADENDLVFLRRHRWRIVDPKVVAHDPMSFREYVQNSGAEFSVAQGIYVDTESGWFSDRTVRYLASGKPALVQDTGFSRNYPTGEGLVAFQTLDQAVAGAERITRDYEKHSRAARALAEEYFDSNKVLGKLIEEVGIML